MTDLAITGKGFFQVSDGISNYYTRAGNFRFYEDGVLRTPSGMSVSGIPLVNGQEQGGLTAVTVNFNDAATAFDPPKASSSLTALMNVNVTTDQVSDPDNPYFSHDRRLERDADAPPGRHGLCAAVGILRQPGQQARGHHSF